MLKEYATTEEGELLRPQDGASNGVSSSFAGVKRLERTLLPAMVLWELPSGVGCGPVAGGTVIGYWSDRCYPS